MLTTASDRRGGVQSWRRLMLGTVTAVLVAGCHEARPGAMLSPQERMDMQNRAQDLLLRAAESDLDDVACNALEALVRVAPRAGQPLFRKALRSTSPLVRYAGFVALGELRDAEVLKSVAAGVRDESLHVRLAAAFAACRCGRDGYARVLTRVLSEAPDENLRADAAALLGRLQEPRATKWLRAALKLPINEKSRHVTLVLRGALAQLGDKDALSELINYSQGDPVARTDALLILADLGNPEARDGLRYRLLGVSEEYDEARLIAARGLGRIGYRDGYDFAMKMLTYTDPNPNPTPDNPSRTFPIRSMAVHALAEIGDPRALPALRDLAADQTDARLQVAASYAICRIAGREAK